MIKYFLKSAIRTRKSTVWVRLPKTFPFQCTSKINPLPFLVRIACGLTLHMSHVPRSVYLCLSVCLCVPVCWAHGWVVQKTSEPMEMPFGQLTHVGPKNHVLYGGPDPHGKGHISGDMCWPFVAYLRMSALRIAPLRRGQICIRRREGWQAGDAAFYQITLDTCCL